jgi:capsid portal protein
MLGVGEILRRLTAALDQQHPRAVASVEQNLSREQVTELRDRIKEALGAGTVPIMTGGSKLTPWSGASVLPKDVQLLEFLQFSREEILAAFHVPPALLGLDRASTGTTSELFLLWKQAGLGRWSRT